MNWFLNIKRKNNSWKEHHNKGGGIMFNYVCHAVYYLEFLFGKIISTKSSIFGEVKRNINSLISVVFFESGLSAILKIKICSKNSKIKPMHQLKILSDKSVYLLRSNVDSLSDQFEIVKIDKSSKKSSIKTKFLFKNKDNRLDFRIKPTFNNSKKFSSWILKGKTQKPNFFDAQRVHLIIDQKIRSSKEKKKMYIN